MNLSIIIPVCNEAKTIADCLGSILSQLTRKQEVLLADYGSDDGTMEVVATFHDARLRVVGPAGSYAEALNRLMEEARGEYVVRINADCIMSPGRLRRQLRFMNLHPEVALAGGFAEFHRMNPLPQQAVFCRKTVGAYRIRPDMSKHEIMAANKYHHIQLNMVNWGGYFSPTNCNERRNH